MWFKLIVSSWIYHTQRTVQYSTYFTSALWSNIKRPMVPQQHNCADNCDCISCYSGGCVGAVLKQGITVLNWPVSKSLQCNHCVSHIDNYSIGDETLVIQTFEYMTCSAMQSGSQPWCLHCTANIDPMRSLVYAALTIQIWNKRRGVACHMFPTFQRDDVLVAAWQSHVFGSRLWTTWDGALVASWLNGPFAIFPKFIVAIFKLSRQNANHNCLTVVPIGCVVWHVTLVFPDNVL